MHTMHNMLHAWQMHTCFIPRLFVTWAAPCWTRNKRTAQGCSCLNIIYICWQVSSVCMILMTHNLILCKVCYYHLFWSLLFLQHNYCLLEGFLWHYCSCWCVQCPAKLVAPMLAGDPKYHLVLCTYFPPSSSLPIVILCLSIFFLKLFNFCSILSHASLSGFHWILLGFSLLHQAPVGCYLLPKCW